MQPLSKPITVNMVNDAPDAQYELLWQANQDDLYMLQPGDDEVTRTIETTAVTCRRRRRCRPACVSWSTPASTKAAALHPFPTSRHGVDAIAARLTRRRRRWRT